MTENVNRVIKSTQEQAVAAWVTYLNQIRLNELIMKLQQQDLNLEGALKELEEIKCFIGDPAHILGSAKTKHGEIAEHMQVNLVNARRAIQGLSENHSFDGVGRTAPEDYIREGQQVQSKFYNGLRNSLFGKHALGAVVGNIAGEFIYDLCKKQGTTRSQRIIENYNSEMVQLNQRLDLQLIKVVLEIRKALERFKDLEKLAFDENINIAFAGSVNLAEEVGVDSNKILRTKDNIDNFFLQ